METHIITILISGALILSGVVFFAVRLSRGKPKPQEKPMDELLRVKSIKNPVSSLPPERGKHP